MDGSSWRTHTLLADGDNRRLMDREWLLTNGTGAFASGTALGCNTRRYHGLLAAAMQPPVGRIIALSQMWEQLVLTHGAEPARGDRGEAIDEAAPAKQAIEFSTLLFRSHDSAGGGGPPVFSPCGHTMLRRFDRGLSVEWSYTWGRIGFNRELFLHWKEQAATIRYRVTGLDELRVAGGSASTGGASGGETVLRLQPMLTLRDYHGLLRRDVASPFEVQTSARGDVLTVDHDGAAVTLAVPGAKFQPNENWWYGVWYPLETDRGQDDWEDYFVPGAFEVRAPTDGEFELVLSVALGREPVEPRPEIRQRAAHLQSALKRLPSGAGPGRNAHRRWPLETLDRCLVIAADDFVVDRTLGGQTLSTVIAGYPWFADWGRDTFIALPGLLLCTRRFDEARAVLRVFAGAIADGLVPNRFDDIAHGSTGPAVGAHYNSADASLWFVHSALAYWRASGDDASWNDWLGAAAGSIVDAYTDGTCYDITMTDDGLITAGSPDTQLTWMDAKCGGRVFTPRPGKTVEINALWYNALIGLSKASEGRSTDRPDTVREARFGADALRRAQRCRALAAKVERSFATVFWNDDLGCLFDHVWTDRAGHAHADRSIRPNQVFAVSLPQSPLTKTRQKQVMRTVRARLLTPFGLRTLPSDDQHYHGRYCGDLYHRDEAYHQGTIWPWLIGPYAEAVLRAGGFSAAARAEASAAISPLLERLVEEPTDGGPACVGQLHEIHEANAPHRAVGCFAQAWSVAELLRVYQLIETR